MLPLRANGYLSTVPRREQTRRLAWPGQGVGFAGGSRLREERPAGKAGAQHGWFWNVHRLVDLSLGPVYNSADLTEGNTAWISRASWS